MLEQGLSRLTRAVGLRVYCVDVTGMLRLFEELGVSTECREEITKGTSSQ